MEPTRKRRVLEAASFGARVAEEEKEALARYFVATDQWKQLVAGDKDIVYGAKGAGKSALYALLVQRKEALFDEGVLVVPVEKLSGVPVFQSLAEDPPASEAEFVAIWKLYFLVLAASVLREWGVETPEAKRVYAALEEAGLLQPRSAPAKILRGVRAYVKRIANPQTVETTVAVDVATGTPTATTRITLGEPAPHLEAAGYLSLDTLLEGADEALGALRFQVWLALDRLDVAFASREELERSALRAVFVAYRDMQALVNLRPKIFIRSDLWRRITEGGFREASHITRDLTLTWDRQSLLQLVVRRLLDNPEICELYGVVPNDVQTDALEQEAFIDRVFPPHVDPQKPESAFDWMLRATEDGLEHSEPREVIHLLSALRDAQLKRWEVGQAPPAGEALFDAASFREALKTVSRVRLEQTLLAENPKLKPFVMRLEGERATLSLQTLSDLWGLRPAAAEQVARQLVDAGFFATRRSKRHPNFWIPPLYRDALRITDESPSTLARFGSRAAQRAAAVLVSSLRGLEPTEVGTRSGEGFEVAALEFNDAYLRQRVVLWLIAAETGSAMSLKDHGDVLGAALMTAERRELDAEENRERMAGSGFRWMSHFRSRRAGFRLVIDLAEVRKRSPEQAGDQLGACARCTRAREVRTPGCDGPRPPDNARGSIAVCCCTARPCRSHARFSTPAADVRRRHFCLGPQMRQRLSARYARPTD